MAKKWYAIAAKVEGKTPEILIYDEIGMWGVSASEFSKDLKALDLKAGDPAILRLNTPGGDCFVGNAIYNMLADTGAKWTIYIDGVAASMGSLIAALPGAHVVIAANAYIMIHNPSGVAYGESKDHQRTAKLLDSIRETMAEAYVAKTGLDLAEVKAMMDEETWLDADEAVRLGFADEKGAENRLAAKFDLAAKFEDIPAEVVESLGKAAALRAKVAPNTKESIMDAKDIAAAVAEANKPLTDAIAALVSAVAPKPKTEAETAKDAYKAYVKDVNGLCALAGFPADAAAFIAEDKSLDDVRAALLAKKSSAPSGSSNRGANRTSASSARVDNHTAAADTEEDISDLVPDPITPEAAFKTFGGKYHGRAH